MSRAYRIRVQESVHRVIRAEDHVGTTLEVLEILPRGEMAGLLRDELIGRGFQAEGDAVVRRDGGVTVSVQPETGAVTVRAEVEREVELTGTRDGYGDTDWGRGGRARAEQTLREQLRQDLDAQADQQTEQARRQATDQLEDALNDLRGELDAVVNRVTAEALKRKAAQLGRIKQITEDEQAGSLTIVVEV
jgi:hypothetical protein